MVRWLVTGASGFIGRRIVKLLDEARVEVHSVARRPGSLPGGETTHYADMLDRDAVTHLIDELCPTHLMALAWCTEHGKFWTDPANDTWRRATLALAEHFLDRGGRAVVGAGSCAEYRWDGSTCREGVTPLEPATPYGRAKAELSAALGDACARRGARYAWGRIFFAYGTGEPQGKLFPSLVNSALANRPLSLREPRRVLDFIHADDVASAFATLALGEMHGACNVATGRPITVERLAATIVAVTGSSSSVRVDEAAAPAPDVTADVAKLESAGWRPRVDIVDGIRETAEGLRVEP